MDDARASPATARGRGLGASAGRARRICTVLLAALLASATAGEASARLTPDLSARLAAEPARPAPVIVTLREQVDPERYAGRPAALLRALRATAARTQPQVIARAGVRARRHWVTNAVAMTVPPATARRLARMRAVATVDLDRTVSLGQAPSLSTPLDSASAGAPGAVQSITQLPLDAIGARAVWASYGLRGAGVLTGNIDTGVDASNTDLAGKIAGFRDFVNGRQAPYDDNGHGTHTIGTMVGGSASGGPIGVAPEARVLVAKALDASGQGLGSALLAAAEWMADPDGDPATRDSPAVVNNSWTGGDANDPWFRQTLRVWRALEIVPVFAAGNAGPGTRTLGSPASYPEALAVAAVDDAGVLADFSSRGPVVWLDPDGAGPTTGTVLQKADLSAPGVAIVSSVGSGYETYSGTSMAAPHVAGVVALLRQAAPGLGAEETVRLLRETATDLGPAGPDPGYGAGAVNAQSAVASRLGPPPEGAVPPPAPDAVPETIPVPPLPRFAPPPPPASGTAPAPASGAPPTPAAPPSPLRVVRARERVLPQGGRLALSGLLTRPARVRAALVPLSPAARRAAGSRPATAAHRSAGRFRLSLALRRAVPGRYRVVVQAQTRAGARLGRPVRLRVSVVRHDRRRPALRRLASLRQAYRALARRPSCDRGRPSARRAAALDRRAASGARGASAGQLWGRVTLARRAVEAQRRAQELCASVAQREPGGTPAPGATASGRPALPALPARPGVGRAGPAQTPVTLANVVRGDALELSAVLGEHQLPAELLLLDLQRLNGRACRGVAVICLGIDRPLVDRELRRIVREHRVRKLAQLDLPAVAALQALSGERDLTELIEVQRADDRVLRLVPVGGLARLSDVPDLPELVVGRVQVVGVLRCPPADAEGLPRVCAA